MGLEVIDFGVNDIDNRLAKMQPGEIDSSRIGFFSSGTTGEPSFSEHDTWRLEREVNHFSTLMPQASRVVSMQ